MCEYILSIIINVLIGLATGYISGSIVNSCCKKESEKVEKERIYKNDVQMYSHYISMIKLILNSKIKKSDDNDILEMIENRPLTYSFGNSLSEGGRAITSEVENILQELKRKVSNNETINYRGVRDKLYKQQLDLLTNAEKFYVK